MAETPAIDYDALRVRFPWIGLGVVEESDFAQRYRDIEARARQDREVVDAIDEVRRGA
jgi:adenosyl cobinamide kinase/adenosyl cobinamide phosphate guanylyltransferase